MNNYNNYNANYHKLINIQEMGEGLHIQQQKLVHKYTVARTKIARNRLILVSILNALTFLSFVFAMAFYEWIWIQLDFSQNKVHNKKYYFWINLLYLKEDQSGSSYENFSTAQNRICSTDIYCKAVFYGLSFVGYLCFSIFCIAGILQMFDFVRIFYVSYKFGGMVQKKDNFRHIITIITYMVGLTLSVFSILVMNVYYRFGVSFWLCIATLVLFVAVIIYQQISIRKVIKQSLIKELLDKEVQARNKKLKQTNMQMVAHHTELVQQGLTI